MSLGSLAGSVSRRRGDLHIAAAPTRRDSLECPASDSKAGLAVLLFVDPSQDLAQAPVLDNGGMTETRCSLSKADCPKGSARDFDNILSVVSKIDHDIWSRRRKLVLSPHCLWLRLLRVGSALAIGQPVSRREAALRVARRSIYASILSVCLSTNFGRTKMDSRSHETIQRDPDYQELVRRRSSFGWTLSLIMLVIYFGFILLVAYAPKFLGMRLGTGVTTIGIPIGLFVIASAFVLTGIYVSKANSKYDALIRRIVEGKRP
jgi:uncharacterized membrane protein (DUF485 family)